MKIPKNDTSYDEEDMHNLVTNEGPADHQVKQKPNPIFNCIFTGIAYVQYFWIYHRAESILAMILFVAVSLSVTGVIEAYEKGQHNKHEHTIGHDYSEIKSSLELKLGQIDHWCLDGTDKHCPTCDDPTKATARAENKWWGKKYMSNVNAAKDYLKTHDSIDVIFLGDSNVEARSGTFKGGTGASKVDNDKEGEVTGGKLVDTLVRSKKKFEKFFDKANGGDYNGLALGISGDTSPNLLWRIKENEFSGLKPQVWWIQVGSNDLLSTNCSEEITIMGILRNVEELLSRNDGATIVINSILPVATRSSLSLEGKHIRNKFWVAIKLVNKRLKNFALKHPGVKFFDASEILTEKRQGNTYMIKKYFTDKVHLSPEGQEALAQAQVNTMKSIMAKKAEKASGTLPSQQTGGGNYRDPNGNAASSQNTVQGDGANFHEYTGDDLYGYPMDDFDDWFGSFGN
jgi:lysophospholipase L1-like esterase